MEKINCDVLIYALGHIVYKEPRVLVICAGGVPLQGFRNRLRLKHAGRRHPYVTIQ